jgi:tetratricopeptide (TPR) repeat protein
VLERIRPAEAEKLYLAAAAYASQRSCARSGLRRITARAASKKAAETAAEKGCAVGKALERAGRDDDARTAYVKALQADPDAGCEDELKALGPDLEERSTDWAKTATDALVLLAAGALAILLLGYLLAIVLGRIWIIRALPVIRRVRDPRLQVATLDDSASPTDKKLGESVSTLLRARVSRPSPFQESLSLIGGQASIASSLKDLTDLNPQLKVLVTFIAVLDRALPRRTFLVEGVLQPKGDPDGVGISVAIKYNDVLRDSWTHWSARYGYSSAEVDGWRQLVVPTAAWVEHEIALKLKAKGLPTLDSESYALLNAGLEFHARGDLQGAERLYDQAWQRDGGNLGAMVNLGLMRARQRRDEEAEDLFEDALELLETFPR